VAGSGGEGCPRASYLIFKRAIISGLRDFAGRPHGLRFGTTRRSRPVGVRDHDPPLADAPPPATIRARCERPAYGRAGRWRRRTSTIPCIVLVAPDSSSWRWRRSASIRLAVCCHCRDQLAIASRPASTGPVEPSIARSPRLGRAGAGEPVVMVRGGSGWASSKRDWSRASARNGAPAGRWDVNRDSDAESKRR